jgi:hypothetical protein
MQEQQQFKYGSVPDSNPYYAQALPGNQPQPVGGVYSQGSSALPQDYYGNQYSGNLNAYPEDDKASAYSIATLLITLSGCCTCGLTCCIGLVMAIYGRYFMKPNPPSKKLILIANYISYLCCLLFCFAILGCIILSNLYASYY